MLMGGAVTKAIRLLTRLGGAIAYEFNLCDRLLFKMNLRVPLCSFTASNWIYFDAFIKENYQCKKNVIIQYLRLLLSAAV